MKRLIEKRKMAFFGALALFAAVAFTSCSSGTKCPAYSKYVKENPESVRV